MRPQDFYTIEELMKFLQAHPENSVTYHREPNTMPLGPYTLSNVTCFYPDIVWFGDLAIYTSGLENVHIHQSVHIAEQATRDTSKDIGYIKVEGKCPGEIFPESKALEEIESRIHENRIKERKDLKGLHPKLHCIDILTKMAFDEIKVEQAPEPTGIHATLAERGKNYGDFETHADIAQALKAIMKGEPFFFSGTKTSYPDMPSYAKEALEMDFHKTARLLNGNWRHRDSWWDKIGYVQLVVDIIDREDANNELLKKDCCNGIKE